MNFATIEELKTKIVNHSLYQKLNTPQALRIFMQHHVFCVWDFQCLIHQIKRRLSYQNNSLYWSPVVPNHYLRLFNEIILEEESDDLPKGFRQKTASHFELYLMAAKQALAPTNTIESFCDQLKQNLPLDEALTICKINPAVGQFIKQTFNYLERNDLSELIGIFTHGRETLIPSMFLKIVEELSKKDPKKWQIFLYYLNRHIEADDERHGPMAKELFEYLCSQKNQKEKALKAAYQTLKARLFLWDEIQKQID